MPDSLLKEKPENLTVERTHFRPKKTQTETWFFIFNLCYFRNLKVKNMKIFKKRKLCNFGGLIKQKLHHGSRIYCYKISFTTLFKMTKLWHFSFYSVPPSPPLIGWADIYLWGREGISKVTLLKHYAVYTIYIRNFNIYTIYVPCPSV